MKQKSLNLCGFQRCSSCKNIPPHSLVDPSLVHSSLVTWSILPWSTRPWLNLFGPIKRLPGRSFPGPLLPGFLVHSSLVTWSILPWLPGSLDPGCLPVNLSAIREPVTRQNVPRSIGSIHSFLVPDSWCVVFCAISRLPGARSLFPGARFLVRFLVTWFAFPGLYFLPRVPEACFYYYE